MSSSIADPVDLSGYVDDRDANPVRIRPDSEDERWLEIPKGDVISIEPAGGELSRVKVKREALTREIFTKDDFVRLEEVFARAPRPLSTWNLIPEDLLTAAGLLELTPDME